MKRYWLVAAALALSCTRTVYVTDTDRPLASCTGGTGGAAGSAGTGGGAGAGGVPQDGGTDAMAGTGGASGGASGAGGGGGTMIAGPYPLQTAPGKRYLVNQQGQPFFLVGDAAWSLMVSISAADADVYLADRQAKGFNTVLVNLVEHKFTTQPPPANAAGDLPFTGTLPSGDLDFTTPNEAYFAHVDQVLNLAAARGIQVLLVPAYLGYQGGDEGWWTEIVANGQSRMSTYGTYVGMRYHSFPNILWVAGADYNPPDTSYTNAVDAAILAVDPSHLHTGHQDSGTSAFEEWGSFPWLKVNDIYGYPALSEYPYDMAETAWGETTMPVFLVESTYEHNTWTASPPQLLRQQQYEAVLSGCFGQVWGNEWVWPFGGPDISGAVHDWHMYLSSQSTSDVTRMANLIGTRRWDLLQPDYNHTYVTNGYTPGSTRASSAVASDGSWGATYMPTRRTITVAMSKLRGSVTARWYNPGTGAFTTVTGSPFPNTGSKTFSPSTSGDWVLLLESP